MTDVPAPIAMLARYRQLLVPLALLSMLAVLIVPVPPSMLDVLLVANISLTIIILLLTVSIDRPLEFSVFPAVLLGVTLLRLVLNVASTRLILTADAATPEQAAAVAAPLLGIETPLELQDVVAVWLLRLDVADRTPLAFHDAVFDEEGLGWIGRSI